MPRSTRASAAAAAAAAAAGPVLQTKADVETWDAATIDSYQGCYDAMLTDEALFALRGRLRADRALRRAIDTDVFMEIVDLCTSMEAERAQAEAERAQAEVERAQAEIQLLRAQSQAFQAQSQAFQARNSELEPPALDIFQEAIATSLFGTISRRASASRGTWAIEVPLLTHWIGFKTTQAKALLQARTFPRSNFRPAKPFDLGCRETPALDFLQLRCTIGMLDGILDKAPFSTHAFEHLREGLTVVNSRPDICWLRDAKVLIVHEQKCPSTMPGIAESSMRGADRANIVDYAMLYEKSSNPIDQVYSYMVVMGVRYGVLSTTEYTWFLRCEESETSACLQVTKGYSCSVAGKHSLRLAYLQLLLYAHQDPSATGQFPASNFLSWSGTLSRNHRGVNSAVNWFDSAEAKTFVQGVIDAFNGGRRFGLLSDAAAAADANRNKNKNTSADAGDGHDDAHRLPLSMDEFVALLPVPWDTAYEAVADSLGTDVKRLTLRNGLKVIIKTLIVGHDELEELEERRGYIENETEVYEALRELQGGFIPILVYGGPVGPAEHNHFVIATLDAGEALDIGGLYFPEDAAASQRVRDALAAVHEAGYLHNAIDATHFVRDPVTGTFRILSFCAATPLSRRKKARAAEINAEREELEDLLNPFRDCE